MKPPFNLAAVEAATVQAVDAGHRILQTHRFAPTDMDHVAYLLRHLNPPSAAVVLDNGCGIGEVSRLMSVLRPDLRFFLTNISPLQLSMCPQGVKFINMLTDSHALRLEDACVDAVMFSSALCQMDEAIALAEAHRVLRPGGILLVNEAVRTAGDGREMEDKLACRTLLGSDLVAAIEAAGFSIDYVEVPQADSDHFEGMLRDAGLGHLIYNISPVIIRARRLA